MTITKQEIIGSLSDLDFNSYNYLRNSFQFSEGDEKLYNLIEIYSFGTISDYLEHRDKLPELSETQLLKLRLLTLLTLSEEGPQEISFKTIQEKLALQTPKSNNNDADSSELLQTLIKLSSSKLINFKIDQSHSKIILKQPKPENSNRDIFTLQDKPLVLLDSSKVANVNDTFEFLQGFLDSKLKKVLKKVETLSPNTGDDAEESNEGVDQSSKIEENQEADDEEVVDVGPTGGVKRRLEH
ncbi:unnamed protein product [Ambrosiozyma monospora]|uniref:Unnamed protein product n=1 Tax=Ambrosiozyma monospora TaxID=43982 RepID=A0A9W7DDW7_AMBMO|nr:unnamed protein product [Ambrosiozyma monospora]